MFVSQQWQHYYHFRFKNQIANFSVSSSNKADDVFSQNNK